MGTQNETLTVAQMPPHQHNIIYGINTSSPGNNVTVMAGGTAYSSPNPIASSGSGQSHNNMPPVIVVNYEVVCG